MAFFPPVPLIRAKAIMRLLHNANAVSEETAKRLDEIGLPRPSAFPGITQKMVKWGWIRQTQDGRYYINK